MVIQRDQSRKSSACVNVLRTVKQFFILRTIGIFLSVNRIVHGLGEQKKEQAETGQTWKQWCEEKKSAQHSFPAEWNCRAYVLIARYPGAYKAGDSIKEVRRGSNGAMNKKLPEAIFLKWFKSPATSSLLATQVRTRLATPSRRSDLEAMVRGTKTRPGRFSI